MDHEPGIDTRDLIALKKPHPAEQHIDLKAQEDAIQAAGARNRRRGIIIIGGSLLTALTVAFLAEGQVFTSISGQIFGLLALLCAINIGRLIASAGYAEIQDRHSRAVARRGLALQEQGRRHDIAVARALDVIADHLPEHDNFVYWRGFNECAQEGLAATGTEPEPSGGRHLGIVPHARPVKPSQVGRNQPTWQRHPPTETGPAD